MHIKDRAEAWRTDGGPVVVQIEPNRVRGGCEWEDREDEVDGQYNIGDAGGVVESEDVP